MPRTYYGADRVLRDEFAKAALNALITEPQWDGAGRSMAALLANPQNTIKDTAAIYAKAAYILADAMMAERDSYLTNAGK